MTHFDATLKTIALKTDTDIQTGVIHRTAVPTLVLAVTEEQCMLLFGEQLRALAFGPMRSDGTLPYKSVKPSTVIGVHDMTFIRTASSPQHHGPVRVSPAIDKIVPADADYHVVIYLQVPFSWDRYRSEGQALIDLLGETIVVHLVPVQQSLELEEG
jgi:hypothetical protein